jgi:hypothetical protein
MTTLMTREVIFIATYYMSYARALRTALVTVLLL